MRAVTIHNETRRRDLARAEWRGSLVGRARGLLGRRGLAADEGIVLTPCSSIHMLLMRFPIDVAYIDREGVVVKTVAALRPYRFSLGGRGAHSAIELAAGTLAATGTRPGDRLAFREEAACQQRPAA
jgi:uncharacterized membrane protein (UPF0127 family)